jgi:hypothetical protein
MGTPSFAVILIGGAILFALGAAIVIYLVVRNKDQ